jgi:hypothetical protein
LILKNASRDLTGTEPGKAERERWRELGEVLITELRIAGARTTVSSVPAFLAEHLRRRLWKIDKKQAAEEGRQESTETKPYISSERAKDCPDCGGTGFYYPKGFEGGVAKCKHERLAREEQDESPG